MQPLFPLSFSSFFSFSLPHPCTKHTQIQAHTRITSSPPFFHILSRRGERGRVYVCVSACVCFLLFLTWLALRKKLVGLYNQGWLKEREREGREWGCADSFQNNRLRSMVCEEEKREEKGDWFCSLSFSLFPHSQPFFLRRMNYTNTQREKKRKIRVPCLNPLYV